MESDKTALPRVDFLTRVPEKPLWCIVRDTRAEQTLAQPSVYGVGLELWVHSRLKGITT